MNKEIELNKSLIEIIIYNLKNNYLNIKDLKKIILIILEFKNEKVIKINMDLFFKKLIQEKIYSYDFLGRTKNKNSFILQLEFLFKNFKLNEQELFFSFFKIKNNILELKINLNYFKQTKKVLINKEYLCLKESSWKNGGWSDFLFYLILSCFIIWNKTKDFEFDFLKIILQIKTTNKKQFLRTIKNSLQRINKIESDYSFEMISIDKRIWIKKTFNKNIKIMNPLSEVKKNLEFENIFKLKNYSLIGSELSITTNLLEIKTEKEYQNIIENYIKTNSNVLKVDSFYSISPFWIIDSLITLKNWDILIIEYKMNSDKRVVSQALGYSNYFTEVLWIDKNKVHTLIIQKKFRKTDLLFLNTIKNLYYYNWNHINNNLLLTSNIDVN